MSAYVLAISSSIQWAERMPTSENEQTTNIAVMQHGWVLDFMSYVPLWERINIDWVDLHCWKRMKNHLCTTQQNLKFLNFMIPLQHCVLQKVNWSFHTSPQCQSNKEQQWILTLDLLIDTWSNVWLSPYTHAAVL